MQYHDRTEAGKRLAKELSQYKGADVLVLALPRGGVPVGFEIAEALEAELDVLIVRKLGAPQNPEFGFGAVASGGIQYVKSQTVDMLGLDQDVVEVIVQRERAELDRRSRQYRGDRPAPRLAGRTVILVDDGLATGGSAIAAIEAVRQGGPKRIVLAVPVAPPGTARRLRPLVDELVCPHTPEEFRAIGEFYRDFHQAGDEEVIELLGRAQERLGAAPPKEAAGAGAAGGPPSSGPAGPRGAGPPRGPSGAWRTGSTQGRPETPPAGRTRAASAGPVEVPIRRLRLEGELVIPAGAAGVVLFAHGSGSSRHSRRNRFVAERLQQAGLATLLMDLLTAGEDREDQVTRRLRFDIPMLAERVTAAVDWLAERSAAAGLPVGLFGASTGAAAALIAAAGRPQRVQAVVSRGGRPDLADAVLPDVACPVRLIVGGADFAVLDMNRHSLARMGCSRDLIVVPGATHLFEEGGALEAVADHAAEWFVQWLTKVRVELTAARGR